MTWDIKRWSFGCRMPGTTRLGGPKAWQPPAWKSVGWFLLSLVFSGSAHAAPEMGPSSSASIRISVSAAARYALRLAAGTSHLRLNHGDPSQFCLETNAIIPQLPVMLISKPEHASASGLTAQDKPVEVPPCGTRGAMVPAIGTRDQVASGMLIVRPE